MSRHLVLVYILLAHFIMITFPGMARHNNSSPDLLAPHADTRFHPVYGDLANESRGMHSVFNTYSGLQKLMTERIKADPSATLLMIGIGRGIAALEIALLFPTLRIQGVNLEPDLFSLEYLFEHLKDRYTANEIRAAYQRIQVQILDIENSNERDPSIHKTQYDFVIIEPYVARYMYDKLQVISDLLNTHIKPNGIFAFQMDHMKMPDLPFFSKQAFSLLRHFLSRSGEIISYVPVIPSGNLSLALPLNTPIGIDVVFRKSSPRALRLPFRFNPLNSVKNAISSRHKPVILSEYVPLPFLKTLKLFLQKSPVTTYA